MNLNIFLKELEKVPYKWKKYTFYNSIIRTEEGFCPITAVCAHKTGKNFPKLEWKDASRELGLDQKTAAKIVATSDCDISDSNFNNNLREKLTRISGNFNYYDTDNIE